MTMPYTTTVKPHNIFFEASREKISMLLKKKTEEIMKATDVVRDIAERYVTNRAWLTLKSGKALLAKVAETSKIGLAGIFAGIFCVFFSLIYTMICYANRRE